MNPVNARIMVDTLKKVTGVNNLVALDGQGTPIPNDIIGIVFIEEIHSISKYVNKILLNSRQQVQSLPVIFLGYKSLKNIIHSEEYPKLLSCEGIYYLELPTSIEKIKNTFRFARNCSVANPEEAIGECMLSPEGLTKEESRISHSLGNLFGADKLVLGAFKNGRVSKNVKDRVLSYIQNVAKGSVNDELILHVKRQQMIAKKLLGEVDADNALNVSENSPDGHILYVDDIAHFGWSKAIAASLWDETLEPKTPEGHHPQDLHIEKFIGPQNRSLTAISKPAELGENGFFQALTNKIERGFLDKFDIVLLDLRLKKSDDERHKDPKDISGIKLLDEIRTQNALLPVVALTASRRARNMEVFYEYNADYFVKEMFSFSESADDVREYSRRFIEKVTSAMEKAYLGIAWRILEPSTHDASLKKEIDYVKNAIALLNKKPTPNDIERLRFDIYREAITNLNLMREEAKLNDVAKTSYYCTSFDRGYLITYLRNISMHNDRIGITETDAKLALYAALRLLSNDTALFTKLADKIHHGIDKPKRGSIRDIKDAAERKLSQLLKKHKEKEITGEDQLNITKNKDKTSADRIVKKEGKDKEKQLAYLFFLARIKFFNKNKETDKNWNGGIDPDYLIYQYILDNECYLA